MLMVQDDGAQVHQPGYILRRSTSGSRKDGPTTGT